MIFSRIQNNPAYKGELAAPKYLFGEHSRYSIAPIHTRFDAVQWFVWDAETLDSNGLPDVIRQFDDPSDAEAFVADIEKKDAEDRGILEHAAWYDISAEIQ